MRVPAIHLDQLVTFFFVATEKSFTAAAERLCVTQPAVTAQIRSLEESFGVKLVHVRKKRVQLSPEGELLLPYATEVYRAAIRAEDLLTQHGPGKVLRIGVASPLAGYVFPVVTLFAELYPSVRVVVREGSSLTLLEALRGFKHDVCFIASLDEVAPDLKRYHLRHAERMTLVAGRGGPLSDREEVDWSDLEGCPLVLHGEGSVARRLILQEFRKRGIEPRIAAEVDNLEYLKQLIELRAAVGLLFSPNVEAELSGHRLKAIPLKSGDLQLGIDVVLPAEAETTPLCAALLSILKRHFGEAFDYAP